MKKCSVITLTGVNYKDFSPERIRICKLQKIFLFHVNIRTKMKSKIFVCLLGNLR